MTGATVPAAFPTRILTIRNKRVILDTDLATLATRIGVRSSLARSLDSLDAFALRVLEALVLGIDSSPAAIAAGFISDVTEADVNAAREEIREALDLPKADDPVGALYEAVAASDAIVRATDGSPFTTLFNRFNIDNNRMLRHAAA